MGPRKHVLDGVEIPRAKRLFLGERTCPGMPDNTAVSCSKMAEPIEMPFGLWTWIDPGKYALDGSS